MFLSTKKIAEQFAEWGKKKKQFPPNNDLLKTKVSGTLVPNEKVSFTRPIRVWWLLLPASAALITLLVIIPKTQTNLPIGQSLGSSGKSLESQTSPSAGISNRDTFGIQEFDGGSDNYVKKSAQTSFCPDCMPYPINPIDQSARDTREYLKTDYNANIRTRDVDHIATYVQTMARGYGGRVDNASIDEKSAYISFVIPKSSLERFESELKSLVPAKFFTKNVSIINLLPNKQNIEYQTTSETDRLAIIKEKQQQLSDSHVKQVAALNSRIGYATKIITTLKNEVTTNTTRIQQIATQINEQNREISAVRQLLTKENTEYKNQFNSYTSQIDSSNRYLGDLKKQDQNLLDNVETVQGSVSIQWISLYDIVDLYVPVRGIIITLLVIIVLGYGIFGRTRKTFEIPS